MRILYVDSLMAGHHLLYAKAFLLDQDIDAYFVFPRKTNEIAEEKQCIVEELPDSFYGYIKWMKRIIDIINTGNYDIVHFLYGDIFYKYFGYLLKEIKKSKVVVTFHQVRRSSLKDLSRKLIFRQIHVGVVHTEWVYNDFREKGIKNVQHIEYPQLNYNEEVPSAEAKAFWGIEESTYVLAAMGTTSYYKGLDILLKALQNVNEDFVLLIAGKEGGITARQIDDLSASYSSRVKKVLHFLNDDEFNMALCAANCVVLPYRNGFDGASGPLTEGVWRRKVIVGPDIGSLKDDIEKYSLGSTFQVENINSLRKTLKEIIKRKQGWNTDSEVFREKLNINYFLRAYHDVYTGNDIGYER